MQSLACYYMQIVVTIKFYQELQIDEFFFLHKWFVKISSCLRDMYGRLDTDHQAIIKEHASQLQEIIIIKFGGLLDELVQRRVITIALRDDIMVSFSYSYI